MNQEINKLTEKLQKNPHYRGRNRMRDYVIFFFTDNHENIINIKITHDEIENEDFTTLKKYL
jgi:hypothetical protein